MESMVSGTLMTTRRVILFACATLMVSRRRLLAQPTRVLPRVAMLYPGEPLPSNELADVFEEAMREGGYVHGRDVVFDLRYVGTPDGTWERLERVISELLQLRLDVIVTIGSQGALAAKKATSTIPIVMATVADPVGQGLVTSLAQPGGNITGNAILTEVVVAKRLELLHSVLPKARKIGFLMNRSNPSAAIILSSLESAAKQLSVTLVHFAASSASEVNAALEQIARQRPEAVMVDQDSVFYIARARIAQRMVREKIPAIYSFREAVADGGLMSYANSTKAMLRRAAIFVVRILKGARPSDLPIEQATTFELEINLKTAKALGLTIPPSLLLQATNVIE